MRILITGGFGFIGGRLGEYLQNLGHEILIGSRNTDNPFLGLSNKFQIIKIEWTKKRSLYEACKNIDVIVHAAGINARDCELNPDAAFNFNGATTSDLLDAAITNCVSKFIFLSTAHVYASPLEGYICEETTPNNSHPYATSNLAGENAVINANKLQRIQGYIFRISNGFGVPINQRVNCWMLLVNDLCKQVAISNKMILTSNGEHERDFISINQICHAIERVALSDLDCKYLNLYNLGTGSSQSVFSMAQLIQARASVILDSMPDIEFKEIRTKNKNWKDKFTYSVDKLNALGIKFNKEDKIKELDELLIYCQSTFS